MINDRIHTIASVLLRIGHDGNEKEKNPHKHTLAVQM